MAPCSQPPRPWVPQAGRLPTELSAHRGPHRRALPCAMLAGNVPPRSLRRRDGGILRLGVVDGSGLSPCPGPRPLLSMCAWSFASGSLRPSPFFRGVGQGPMCPNQTPDAQAPAGSLASGGVIKALDRGGAWTPASGDSCCSPPVSSLVPDPSLRPTSARSSALPALAQPPPHHLPGLHTALRPRPVRPSYPPAQSAPCSSELRAQQRTLTCCLWPGTAPPTFSPALSPPPGVLSSTRPGPMLGTGVPQPA